MVKCGTEYFDIERRSVAVLVIKMKFAVFLVGFLVVYVTATSEDTERLVNSPGHLKPLGEGRPIHDVEQFDGFPYPKWFFDNHVRESKPLLMRNAAKVSPAFSRWTDDYFLSQDEPEGHTVSVELKKKENRTFGVEDYSFKKFVRSYNESDIYMVNAVPWFVASDVVLPGPLQCDALLEGGILVDRLMWFSSGGTKSVVHTDSVDNINCLFRGTKTLLFVSGEFADLVDIDHPESAYSDIDVDKVDFTKYPGLADVEYHRVNMEPGDCLYIPFKWIHQVRSFDSNIAVNIWWDHFKGLDLDVDKCPDEFSEGITLDKLEFTGFGNEEMTIPVMKGHFESFVQQGSLDFEKTIQMLLGNTEELERMDPAMNYRHYIRRIFLLLDTNRNNKIEHSEVTSAEDETWEKVIDEMQDFDHMVRAIEEKYQQEDEDDGPSRGRDEL